MIRFKSVFASCLAFACLLGALSAPDAAAAAAPAASPSGPGNPPVLAVYYAWYDANTWASGKTSDLPATPYTSSDRAAIARQVSQAQSAGIDGFELNWWGPGNPTDTNLQALLDVARPTGFKVAAYVDLNGPSFNSAADVASALVYIQRYFSDPAYFHFNGKPFVAFYHSVKFDTSTWSSIFSQVDPGHQVFWMGEGADMSYASVFDGMHPFSVAWAGDPAGQLATFNSRVNAYPGKVFVPTVMAGYDDTRLGRGAAGFAVDRAAGAYYTKIWQGALALNPSIVSITSWNEWMEGSQIEPSQTYGDRYLQITRQQISALRGTGANCSYLLGFRTLHAALPGVIGGCLDNQAFAANGDAVQHSADGLLVWRKADNWTAFTDGFHTWLSGPNGVQERLNTERFPWEAR